MTYTIDTNILVHLLTGSHIGKLILEIFNDEAPFIIISIVTKAEILSISTQRGWGKKKQKMLQTLFAETLIVPIDTDEIVKVYADLDSFSQGKHPSFALESSARNMGKNDLWIAATAKITGSTLLTTDNDFDHLNHTFINILKP